VNNQDLISTFNNLPDSGSDFLLSKEKVLSFSAFKSRVIERASSLQCIQPGDLVCIETGRNLEYFIDLFAVWVRHAVAVPLAFDLSDIHRNSIIKNTNARITLSNTDILHSDKPFGHLPAASAVLFTSGTTGMPKGVVLTEKAVMGNALSTMACLDLHMGDVLFTNIPFQFTSLLSHFMVCALTHAAIFVHEDRILNNDFVNLLVYSCANCFGGSPTQLLWIVQSQMNLSKNFKWLMSSGDFLPPTVIKEIRQRYPNLDIHTFYGITELAGRFCNLSPSDIDQKIGAVGFPIGGLSYKLLDENQNEVEPGELGEIYADGDFLLTEYLNDPGSTQAVKTTHGYKTGDMGYCDKDGYLYHVGRNDDVFKSGGQKVSGVLIRDELLQLKLFKDVAVVPKEEEILGTVPVACLVPLNQACLKKGEILRGLRKTLPANHIPKKIYILDEIPRTGSGKVAKKQLDMLLKTTGYASEL